MTEKRTQATQRGTSVLTATKGRRDAGATRSPRLGRSAFATVLTFVLLAVASIAAAAADFQLGSSLGTWTWVNQSVQGLNTSAIWWGTSTGYGQSGFEFGGSTGASFNANELFVVGTFTHHNKPITGSNLPTAMDLRVQLHFASPAVSPDPVFTYRINYEETPNTSGHCPAWQVSSTPCDDRAIFPASGSANTFWIGDTQYQLEIIGFVRSLTSPFPMLEFVTEEKLDNVAYLVGRLTVPTPGCSGYQVNYTGRTVSGGRTQFRYRVTVDAGAPFDLSHWVLGLPDCITSGMVSSADPTSWTFGTDPNTGVRGIKWDVSITKGTSRDFYVWFNGEWAEATVTAAVKAGTTTCSKTTTGPRCGQPALTLEKRTNGDDADATPGPSVLVGQTVTWSYVVTNAGDVTFENIAVTDDKVGAIGTIASLAPGVSTTLTKTGTAIAGQYKNTGTATATYGGATFSASDAAHYFGTQPEADLRVVKVGGPDPVMAGQTLTYTVTVWNDGPSAATGVAVTDTLPVGVSLVSFTTSQGSLSGNVWTVGNLAVGASATLTLVVNVGPGTTGTLTNTACASGSQTDPNSANNCGSTTTTVTQRSDLRVAKTDSPDPVVAGQPLTYTIVVTNDGPSNATGVSVADTLPAGVTFSSATSSVGTYSSTTTIWTVGNLAVGASATLTLVVNVGPGTIGTLTNTACATGSQTDPNSANNCGSTTTMVLVPAMTMEKSGPASTSVGDPVTYTLRVTNTGTAVLHDVVVTDSKLGFNQTIGTLAVGASETYELTYGPVTELDLPGPIVNTAVADSAETTAVSDSHSVAIVASPGITVDKTAPAGPFAVGDTITYTFIITNTGNVTLHGITITDPLGGLSAITGYATTLAPGYLTTGTASYLVTQADVDRGSIVNTATVQGLPPYGEAVSDTDGNTVTFGQTPALAVSKTGDLGPVLMGGSVDYTIIVSNVGNVTLHDVVVRDARLSDWSETIGTLAVGASETYELTYGPVTELDLPGPIVNTAVADSAETTAVSDSHSVAIVASPGITVDKTAPAGPFAVGDTITYTFIITNTGNVTLHGITITDPLGGLSAITGYATTLAPGYLTTGTASYLVTQADVDRGSIVNTATVQGLPPYGEAVSDTDGNTVTFGQTPALAVSKTGDLGPVLMGGSVDYTIIVSNVGNVTLHDVVVRDARLSDWSETIGTLAVGASETYELTYGPVTELDLPGPIVNTAVADSAETTAVSDSHSVAIVASPGITVDKTAPAGPFAVGDTITYTFIITNTGNVTLHGITITDPLGGLSAITGYATTLAPGYLTTGTASYLVTQADVDRGSIVNTATVQGLPPYGEAVSDTDGNTVTFGQTPALAVSKTGDLGPVLMGGSVDYTIIVSNVGNVTLHDVVVRDARLSDWSETIGTLAVGASETYELTYGPVTELDLPGPIVNTAVADSAETTAVSDSHSVAIVASPGITVDKTAPAGPFAVGDTITYTFIITNTGNVTLHGITITDPLGGLSAITGYATTLAPGYLTTGTASYLVTQADVDRGSIVNTATVQGLPPYGEAVSDTDGNTVTFGQTPALAVSKTGDLGPVLMGGSVDYTIIVSNVGNVTLHDVVVRDARLSDWSETIGTLAVGASETYELTYGPVTELDLPGPIVNTAVADSAETTAVSDSHSVAIVRPIDLSVTQQASTLTPVIGDVVTFTITLSNAPGWADATGAVVAHDLGAGLALVSASASRGSYTSGTGMWSVGSLASGEDMTLEIQALVLGSGPYTSSAEVWAAGQVDVDSVPANAALVHEDDDSEVELKPQTRQADLAITKTVSNATPSAGDLVDFSITVQNLGPNDDTGIVVADALPAGLLYMVDDGGGAYSFATDLWTIGPLAVGASATLRITALVEEGALGSTITNQAEITAHDLPDPNATNDQATASISVEAADLAVTKTVDSASPSEGDTVTFTVTLTNLGPNAALGIRVSDVLPTGLAYVSHGGNGVYDPALGTWALGSLIAGRSASLTITATVAAGTAGSTLSNVAEITRSNVTDPDPSNNRAQADVQVAQGGGAGGAASDGCTGRVIINEVAWAGTAADPESQWIELRNVGTAPVDLNGWTLRWRKKVPVTVEDYLWKEIALSGVLQGAGTSACELALEEQIADIEFTKRDSDDVSWLVVAKPAEDDGSYLLLERKSDDTIRNIEADIVYDMEEPYSLDLSLDGDVMELRDRAGNSVDTANAFEPIVNEWPAGDASTYATMERTDPLAPDAADNWHTNIGIVTRGEDAAGTPLVATAGTANSEPIEEWVLYAERLAPVSTHVGARFDVGLELTQAERRETGWPWIRVSYLASDVAGAGASVAETPTYVFGGRYTQDGYWVNIDTAFMVPGEYLIWIVFGESEAVLVPLTVLP